MDIYRTGCNFYYRHFSLAGKAEPGKSLYLLSGKGTFEKYIETKGEVHGKNALYITLNDIFKDYELGIRDLKIKDMVPEGTIVKKGDWVATLDQAVINQRIQENREELERRLAYLNDAIIDSTITLTNMRQRITELQFELQYSELDLEQAQYESPAYQRRIQVAYNQNVRQIDRAKRDYELRRIDLGNRLRRYEEQYERYVKIDENLGIALEACSIRSPQPWFGGLCTCKGPKNQDR
jgi:hypothetical protein